MSIITTAEARRLATLWRDPLEHPDDPDPLATFGRTGKIDADGVLQALWEIELVTPADARHELYALLDYFAEATS